MPTVFPKRATYPIQSQDILPLQLRFTKLLKLILFFSVGSRVRQSCNTIVEASKAQRLFIYIHEACHNVAGSHIMTRYNYFVVKVSSSLVLCSLWLGSALCHFQQKFPVLEQENCVGNVVIFL